MAHHLSSAPPTAPHRSAIAQQRIAVQHGALPCGADCAMLCGVVRSCAVLCRDVSVLTTLLCLLFRGCATVVSCQVPAELDLCRQLSLAQLSSAAALAQQRIAPCSAVLCRALQCCVLWCTYPFVHASIIRSIIPRTGTTSTIPGLYTLRC